MCRDGPPRAKANYHSRSDTIPSSCRHLKETVEPQRSMKTSRYGFRDQYICQKFIKSRIHRSKAEKADHRKHESEKSKWNSSRKWQQKMDVLENRNVLGENAWCSKRRLITFAIRIDRIPG
jgi:hypothetical protein